MVQALRVTIYLLFCPYGRLTQKRHPETNWCM